MNKSFNKDQIESRLKLLFIASMKGDAESYENFLVLVSALAKQCLLKMGGKFTPIQEIEDLLQEVMIKVHEKKHTFIIDRKMLPWIYAVTRHSYIDYYRKKQTLPRFEPLNQEFALNPENEISSAFEEIKSFLSPKQWLMLETVKLEENSYQDAAQMLQTTVPALKVGIHRIMQNLIKRGPK